MDLRTVLAADGEGAPERICSAKGCRRAATWALRWNNPKLHEPKRRKVWLACDEHEASLRDFLGVRGFHRDTVRPGDLGPHHG